jgi:outer membrane protein
MLNSFKHKSQALGLGMLSVALMLGQVAHAAGIGTIDLDKVVGGYNKAQSVMSDIKVKEADLRKMQADYVKQLEDARKANAKNPVTADQLEKDLNAKLTTKLTEYRNWSTAKQKEIDNDLQVTIKAVAAAKGLDIVLSKDAVFQGGSDITNDVLGKLNK